MLKINLFVFLLINVTFGFPKINRNEHAIIFPSDVEDEKRYNFIKAHSKKIASIVYPKDDYNDTDDNDEDSNRTQFSYENHSLKKLEHNPEYHRISSNKIEEEKNETNSDQVKGFDSRFLFRAILNCPCKFNGKCSKRQIC